MPKADVHGLISSSRQSLFTDGETEVKQVKPLAEPRVEPEVTQAPQPPQPLPLPQLQGASPSWDMGWCPKPGEGCSPGGAGIGTCLKGSVFLLGCSLSSSSGE